MAASYRQLWRALNWPNRISLFRVLGVGPFVVLLLHQQAWPPARYGAMGVFVLMGLSDALDGYLARRTGQTTQLGAILDPLADKLLITCAAVLLATRRASVPEAVLPSWVVVLIVGKDLWVVLGFLVVFLITGHVHIQPTRAGKTCTMGQIVMVAGVLAAPDLNRLGGRVGSYVAMALGWAVMALCVLSIASYTRLGLTFVTEDEQPDETTDPSSGDDDVDME